MTPHRPLALSALLAALSGPALAAGLDQTPPDFVAPAPQPAAPTYAPGNDWTGFYGGVQLGYGRIDDRTDPEVFDDDFAGATYGGHVGYLYDFGRVVVGAELDLEGTNLEDEATGLNVDRLARAKLRLGFDAGRVLPYLTGGVVQATTSGFADLEDTGGFAGFGVDYQATERMRVGAEVLQHRFEDFDDTGIDFDATTVSARVSFNF
ncbi:outer membrane protein [Histidinibacterium lentulum]|uniref:Porin family protein n=1 Tax=Histidinibacterium lentulum TaxID=2480588 RepID=A0A3N2R991_9RHOB|nr:outer membrane beta-barrel protein [Histidinibacterium lentulum]ROU04032.1 porin family protein [Histidinibacterium lentulum]